MLIYCMAANAYLDGQSNWPLEGGSVVWKALIPPVHHFMVLYDSLGFVINSNID